MRLLRLRAPGPFSNNFYPALRSAAIALLGVIKIGLPAAAVIIALGSSVSPSSAQSPFPDRDGFIANGTDKVLSEARIQDEFASRLGDRYELDGLALMVDSCQPDPEVYLDEALLHYGMAPEPGAMYDDAVVWLVCFEPRYVGFFYGAENPYAPEFDQAGVADTASGAMAERLAAGNYTGGLTSGIDAVADLLEGNVPLDAGAAQPAPAGETTLPTGAADDNGGSLGSQLAAAGAVGLGGLWLWRRRKREDERKQADQTGKEAKKTSPGSPRATLQTKLAKLEGSLTQDSQAVARLILAYQSIGEDAMLEVSQRHDGMLGRLMQLRTTVAELPEVGAETGGTMDARLQDRYAEADDEAEVLLAYAHEIEAEADHVDMLEERAAVLTVEARKAIAAGREHYLSLLSQLEPDATQLPDATDAFDVPTQLAEQSEQVLATGDRITAGRLAEDAASLAEHGPKLLEEALSVDARIEEGVAIFDRVESYAEANWADIRGNGSEAEESLDAALEMYRRVLAASPDDFGADIAAGYMASLERVAAELGRARGLVDAIADRLERLDKARIGAVDEIDAVRADIAKARRFLSQPEVAGDVGAEPEAELLRAEALLDELTQGMAEDQPDWLAITRNIHSAAGKTELALAEARRQNDQLDALRRHWESASEAAANALQRAEQYLALHRADVTSASSELGTARKRLQRAERDARQAEALEDSARADMLTRAIEAAEEADADADTAYETMAAAVAKADKSRAYVPRPDWLGPTVPMPMPRRRNIFIPGPFNVGMGPIIRGARKSSWGSRPRPKTRPVRPRSIRRSGGGRSSSGRRGGGRGW